MATLKNDILVIKGDITNHGVLHVASGKKIDEMSSILSMMIEWKKSIEESTEVNREMLEVGRAILKASSWLFTLAKWVVMVGGAIGLLLAALKSFLTFR